MTKSTLCTCPYRGMCGYKDKHGINMNMNLLTLSVSFPEPENNKVNTTGLKAAFD